MIKNRNLDVFILNRLKKIENFCNISPIQFHFAEGRSNPADYASRPTSYRKLKESCFHTGPDYIKENLSDNHDGILIPNPLNCSQFFNASVVEKADSPLNHEITSESSEALKDQ